MFKEFALQSSTLKQLYNVWVKGKYELRLRPTPDRIDSELGYELSNVRFLSFSDNARAGGIRSQMLNRKHKKRKKQ